MSDILNIIAGQTVEIRLDVTDDADAALDFSSGYTVTYTLVRGTDPNSVQVEKVSTGSGLTGLDMSNAASGYVLDELAHSQTSAMKPGTYTSQWEVSLDSDPDGNTFKVAGDTIRVTARDYTG